MYYTVLKYFVKKKLWNGTKQLSVLCLHKNRIKENILLPNDKTLYEDYKKIQ